MKNSESGLFPGYSELADDPGLIATIQEALTRTGRYPLLGLSDALSMRQRLAFPAAA